MRGKAPLRVVEVASPKASVRLPHVPVPFTVKVTDWPTRAEGGVGMSDVIVPGAAVTVTEVLAEPVQLDTPVAVAVKVAAVL